MGDHDTGKTIAAMQVSNNMKDVTFVDDDIKGDGTVRQMRDAGMEFDEYIDLASLRLELGNAPTPDELLQYVVMPTIERIKAKKRKVIIWDTWRIVYQAARGHVERNQSKYSNVVTFRGTNSIIQGLISKVARMIETKQLNELKAVSELLIITHHVKDNYVANVVVGKIPESSATFSEVCNMRMWLRRNTKSKVPIILFLKRPNTPRIVKGKLQFVNIVPLKVTPTDKHESIWDAIAEYEADPIQSRMPTADETPTAEELYAISGTLTQEQQGFVKSMIAYNLEAEKELADAVKEIHSTVHIEKEDEEESKAPKDAVQLIAMAKAELGYDLSDIERIVGKSFAVMNLDYKPKYWDTLVQVHDMQIAEAVEQPKKKKK